jgi:hypothetical protein
VEGPAVAVAFAVVCFKSSSFAVVCFKSSFRAEGEESRRTTTSPCRFRLSNLGLFYLSFPRKRESAFCLYRCPYPSEGHGFSHAETDKEKGALAPEVLFPDFTAKSLSSGTTIQVRIYY